MSFVRSVRGTGSRAALTALWPWLAAVGYRNFAMRYRTLSTHLHTAHCDLASPSLAEQLTQAESKLIPEERSAALDHRASGVSAPLSAHFYKQFIATVANRV